MTPSSDATTCACTEETEPGTQYLLGDVAPISQRQRLEALFHIPTLPRVRQKPCDIGLFDEYSRRQIELF